MAEYRFTFDVPKRYEPEARQWLRFFRSYARLITSLHVTSSTSKGKRRDSMIHVRVSGPLPQMQLFARLVPQQLIGYVLPRPNGLRLLSRVIAPFLQSNKAGIERITGKTFQIASALLARGCTVDLPELTMAPKLMRRGAIRKPRSREDRAVRDLVNAVDAGLSGRITREQAVIGGDQAVESWLKARLAVPTTSKVYFPVLVSDATQIGLLTKREAYRVKVCHRTRNGVQHAGKKIRGKTMNRMFAFLVRLLNDKL